MIYAPGMKLPAVVVCLAVPSLALAQAPPPDTEEPPPPPAPAPAPEPPPPTPAEVPHAVIAPPAEPPAPEPTGPPAHGFQIVGRMPTQLGLTSVITPGFSIGFRMNKVVLGLQLGVTEGKLSNDSTTDAFQLYSAMPTISDDLWLSADGRARMNVVVGVGYGKGSIQTTDTANMQPTTESDITFLPTLVALGGDYYLSPNFALGVEIAAEIPVVLSVTQNGMDQSESGFADAVHGVFRITFIAGS